MTSLIRFDDQVLVQVAESAERSQPVVSNAADRISRTFAQQLDLLTPIVSSVANFLRNGVQGFEVENAEVELGVGVSAEGSLFVTKASAETNLKLTIRYKSKG